MDLTVGDTVVYSVPLEGVEAGTLFTSIARVSGVSPTHVTLDGAEKCKFPYTPSTLPLVHRTPKHSEKDVLVKEFKVPRLFIRRVMSKKNQIDPKVAEGVYSDDGTLGYTMWPIDFHDRSHDYVFCILTFDMRKLTSFASRHSSSRP